MVAQPRSSSCAEVGPEVTRPKEFWENDGTECCHHYSHHTTVVMTHGVQKLGVGHACQTR
jgi:hypothetical protein